MTHLCVSFYVLWTRVVARLKRTLTEEKGATVAEYALVLVLIAVALITVLGDLGQALQDRIRDVIDKLPATP